MANSTITETIIESKKAATTGNKSRPYLHLTPLKQFQVGKKQRIAEFGVINPHYAKAFPDLSLKEPTIRQ